MVPFDPVSPRHQETGDRVLTRLSSMDSGARAFCVTAKAIRNWTVEEGLGYERVPRRPNYATLPRHLNQCRKLCRARPKGNHDLKSDCIGKFEFFYKAMKTYLSKPRTEMLLPYTLPSSTKGRQSIRSLAVEKSVADESCHFGAQPLGFGKSVLLFARLVS